MNSPRLPHLLGLCLLFGTMGCVHTQQARSVLTEKAQENLAFATFTSGFLQELWQLDPDWALSVGYDQTLDRVEIPDSEHRARYVEFCRRTQKTLAALDRRSLSASEAIDARLIEDFLLETIWQLEVFRAYSWNPAVFNISSGLGHLFETPRLSIETKLRSATLRLAAAPAYYAAARSSLVDSTLEHTALAIKQHAGVLEEWNSHYPSKLAESQLSPSEKSKFLLALKQASTAVTEHIHWLEDLQQRLQKQGARSFRLSPALYRQKFGFELGSSASPEAIYEKALAAKEQTLLKMDAIARRLYAVYAPGKAEPSDRLQRIKAVINVLSQEHVEPPFFRQAIAAQIPKLEEFVRRHDLVYLDPAKPLVVRDTPLYARGIAGASIDAPGPYDQSGDTYYNVTPLDDLSAEQAASYLREYNAYTLQILNIHEAIPGHYAQLLNANRSPSLIKSLLGNGTMIEGWAVYAERMMLEQGYNESPELWLMYYKWHLRVILNTILDYEIHNKNLSREAALAMLTGEGFQETTEANEKWKRATLTQVQLASYFTGFSETYELREELKRREGAQFNLRRFHDRYLSFGSAPIRYIRELLLAPESRVSMAPSAVSNERIEP